MRFSFSNARVFVLVAILSLSIVPTSVAAPRENNGSRFDRERVIRIFRQVLKQFGITTNSDQITNPKP